MLLTYHTHPTALASIHSFLALSGQTDRKAHSALVLLLLHRRLRVLSWTDRLSGRRGWVRNGSARSIRIINSISSTLNRLLPMARCSGPVTCGSTSICSSLSRSMSSIPRLVLSPVAVADVAIFLLAFNKWATQVKPAIDLSISRWIFSGCIIFSFLLLAKDWWTARKIILSRDISFAYTNLIGIPPW